MKRMELKIALTFAIIFVIGAIINGLYSVISLGEGFFTFNVMAYAIFYALVYLFFIWLNTRRHQILAHLGFMALGLFLIFVYYSSNENTSGIVSNWNMRDTLEIIYCISIYLTADSHSKKLLKEEEND